MQMASNKDVSLQHNYMVVMSNSMSTQDFNQMMEDGYRPGSVDSEVVVTVMDKIKATLAEAGVDIEGYNDDLKTADIEQALGIKTIGKAGESQIYDEETLNLDEKIKSSLEERDIPVHKENIEKAKVAVQKAMSIENIDEGIMHYGVSNHVEATIDNLYMAKYQSGAGKVSEGGSYFQEDTMGYLGKKAKGEDLLDVVPQIKEVIKESGHEITDETMDASQWILKGGIPLTKENIDKAMELKAISLPLEEDQAIALVTTAMENGKAPGESLLTGEESLWERAKDLYSTIRWEERRVGKAC